MKKKIAVFATGWSEQMISEYMYGIRDGINSVSADVYAFVCYPALTDLEEYVNGELNIFNLPDLNDFDGVLVLGNTIDFPEVLSDLSDRCKAAGIPIVCTGNRMEGAYFVGSDNYYGARSLCEHLYDVHGVRDFFYIAGSRDNMDSNIRLQAIKDILSDNGKTFSDDSVFYTDWSPKNEMIFIREWIGSGRKLPDAFVCANDELAILMCEELRRADFSVPDDVLVTGFDNIPPAQIYDPSISSVSQNFDKIGYESVRMLLDVLEGREREKDYSVRCEFVAGESCGCSECSNADDLRRESGRNSFINTISSSAFYRKLSYIDRFIAKGTRYEDIRDNFKSINDEFNYYEGTSYHVLIDPVYTEKMYGSEAEYGTWGYPDKMEIFFSTECGESIKSGRIDVKEIVPQVKNPDENHLFICLPLQDMGSCMGYVVFVDDYDKFKTSEFMGKYSERLSAALVKFQQMVNARVLNEKLTELYQTDALTHVKNRAAYQSRERDVNEKIKLNESDDFALLLADVNGLKAVNDILGHESGDLYIRNCCSLICKTFKRCAVYRIGGDEFVVFLEGEDFKKADELVKYVNDEIARLSGMDIPEWEKISVAMGVSYYDRENDTCMADVLGRADKAMYERKRIMKNS